MKRFLKTFVFFIVSLFCVLSGVNTTLDHMSHMPTQNSLTWYNEKGITIITYNGDLSAARPYIHPSTPGLPRVLFLHRTSTASDISSPRSSGPDVL